ncbi:ABC transporter permease [uncultured Roseovarius sp.]|uniref:ABC transporter permease n=1 Tax=uncultured Roseovarius sp. TaxID=293344 RepID=UPI000C9701EC|nr:spermidine/putrescine ABC transporter permease [Roseovarius sp.]|tara:strand:- start:237 stop:1079 length:843 start_codon:yes stop_codon:yes gene_type:complete
MTRPSLYSLTLALPLLIWQLAFFAVPLIFLIAISFWSVRNFQMMPDLNFGNWERILTRSVFWDAYLRTAILATTSAVLTSFIAFPAAYAISFKLSERVKQWLIFVLIIPFFTSYLVRIYALQVFLSDEGIINAVLGMLGIGPFGMLNTTFGTLVGMVTLCLPLVILLQVFSLNFVNRDLVEAAHNLRCGRLRTVLAVIVPSARVGLVIAALFAFILSFGDFVSPLYLGGGNPPTLSILITDITKSGQQWPRAAVVALMMIGTLLSVALAAITYAYKERGK